jgi:hypothetical protein
MVLIPGANVNKLMMSFTDNLLCLYDFNPGNSELAASITHLPFSVLTMCYWYAKLMAS